LGENYVEEAQAKIEMIPVESDIEWHMIGHIQSRKAKLVVEYFSYVHSVDSFKLANKLAGFCRETGKKLPVLLECNVTGEESKFGWECWDKQTWPAMVDQVIQLQEIQGIYLRGLMTMAPYYADPGLARPVFRNLRMLRDYLASRVSNSGLQELSMGMSGDFEVAVDEGSTMVRIGTAIFGKRKTIN
jgi:PLP dependent protein